MHPIIKANFTKYPNLSFFSLFSCLPKSNFIQVFFFIQISFLIISPSDSLANCGPSIGSCEFYKCKSKELNCDPKNYLTSFGYRYCTQFDLDQNLFSESGQRFLSFIKSCLQENLEVSVNEHNGQPTHCRQVEKLAQKHHVLCYREGGFCSLDSDDKNKIAIVTHEAFLKNSKFRKTGIKILKSCSNSPSQVSSENR